MFKYLNLNPDKRTTTDCVIRAVSFVTDEDWETTFIGIAVECLIYHDMPEYNYIWAEYLRKKGFRKHILPDTCPVCYTVKDFCIDHPFGTYLLVKRDNVVSTQGYSQSNQLPMREDMSQYVKTSDLEAKVEELVNKALEK